MAVLPSDNTKNLSGAATLFSVLIIGFIGVSITVSVLIAALNAVRSTGDAYDFLIATQNADSCAETALFNLHNDSLYNGPEVITLDDGECEIIQVLGSGDNNRIIQLEGRYRSFTARVSVDAATIRPEVTLNSWRDVADF